MTKVIVVKIGGATFGSDETTIEDIVYLQKRGNRQLVMVHGGGNLITEWLKKRGLSTKFIQGERVTDQATLEVVTAVLAGLVNKEIVAAINDLGGRAVGISGIDGALIQSKLKNEEMGYVGEIVKVNTTLLNALLQAGFIPVVAPLGLYSVDRPDDAPVVLNINGDIVAGEITAAIGAEKLIFLTDVAGIIGKSGKLISNLLPYEAEALILSGVASGGMIPKIKACLTALSSASIASIIDGTQPHALLREVVEGSCGTTIGSGK